MVAVNRLTGHSPGFFSVYSLPPNQAVSAEARRRSTRAASGAAPRDVRGIIIEEPSLLADVTPAVRGACSASPRARNF